MVQRTLQSAIDPRTHRPRGFTLVELLVVIAIIGVLISLVFVIAHHVAGSGKQRATEGVLKVLDSALQEYIDAKGSYPSSTVLDPRDTPNANPRHIIPVIDGRNYSAPNDTVGDNAGHPTFINSVGLFMLQCKEVPAAEAQFKSLDARLAHEYDPDAEDAPNSPNFAQQPRLLTAFDGWGHPIRYVHPAFKGNVVRDLMARPPAQVDFLSLYPPPRTRFTASV